MGLVVFSGFAELTVPPTTDRDALVKAIDGLTTGPGTAIGAAILKGLDAVAEVNPGVAAGRRATFGPDPGGRQGRRRRLCARHRRGVHRRRQQPWHRAAPGGAVCDRAARAGLHDRLRHDQPGAAGCTQAQLGGDIFDSPAASAAAAGSRAGSGVVGSVASSSRTRPPCRRSRRGPAGRSTAPRTPTQLEKVFADLPKEVRTQKERQEITWWFAALGGLLALGAIAASMRWSAYP